MTYKARDQLLLSTIWWAGSHDSSDRQYLNSNCCNHGDFSNTLLSAKIMANRVVVSEVIAWIC